MMDEGSTAHQPQPGKRMLRGHQPARAVLLDMSHVLEVKLWHRVLSALHNLMSIVCSMAGPPRIPLISIYLLDAYPEVMLPFSPPKGNLCRIVSALRDIKTCIEDSLQSSAARSISCLDLAITEACSQYKRHLNAMGQLQGRSNVQMDQLEVVVISGISQSSARTAMDGLGSQLDMTHLKRLLVALLTTNMVDDVQSSNSSNTNCSKDSDDSNGIMDFVHLETDEGSLQKFFYTWLLDNSGDSEHLHLTLPPASPVDTELLIKCDLVERIVNPAQLPHHEFFSLHSDSTHCKMAFPCPSKAAGLTVPVYTLKVLATLSADSVCDSLLFGLPLIVQPTTCWRIDWEELEENTANFHSLCAELLSKSQVLLVQLQPMKNVQSTVSTSRHSTSNINNNAARDAACSIRGMFVLLPAPSSTLLLKPLATRELILPATWSVSAGEMGAESTLRVQSSLTQVPELSTYNPLSYSCGLLDVLLAQAVPKQQAVRPRPAAKRRASAPKEPEVPDRTWSEMTSHVGLPTSAITSLQARGSYPVFPARMNHTRTSAPFGRERLTTRRPDGFLMDLE